jgi:aspartate/methionine/tyrosine aminotransferase
VIVVSSLSKDRSLPGLRVGWIIAPPRLIDELGKYNELIVQASPTPTAALLFVDMLCRAIATTVEDTPNDAGRREAVAETFVERAMAFAPLEPGLTDFITPYTHPEHLHTTWEQYQAWQTGLLNLLRCNWHLLIDNYSDHLVIGAPWQGGFNTFVQLPVLNHVDPYQFTIDFFRQRGIQILPGPCFGSIYADWLPRQGFWVRISFAMDTPELAEGMAQLITFAQGYRRLRTNIDKKLSINHFQTTTPSK